MGHYDDDFRYFYETKPKVSLNSETKKSLKIGADPEVQRLRDALCTIGALLYKTFESNGNRPVNVEVALSVINTTLDGEWPSYGVVPKGAKEYLEIRKNEDTIDKKI